MTQRPEEAGSRVFARSGSVVLSCYGATPSTRLLFALLTILQVLPDERSAADLNVVPLWDNSADHFEELAQGLHIFVSDTNPFLHRERFLTVCQHDNDTDVLSVAMTEFVRERAPLIESALTSFLDNDTRVA